MNRDSASLLATQPSAYYGAPKEVDPSLSPFGDGSPERVASVAAVATLHKRMIVRQNEGFMMSYGGTSGDNESQAERVEGHDAEALPDSSILEEVVRATLNLVGEPAGSSELDALFRVAQRYRGGALTVDPVASELVETVLRIRLSALAAPNETWRSMSLEVANSLMDAPDMRQRLQQLWVAITESNQ